MAQEFEITEATVADIHDAYEAGTLTCRELVEQYEQRIEAYDRNGPELNAVVTVNPHAVERAEELDEAFESEGLVGPLHGIPVAIKDQVETAGVRTTFGSEAFADYQPSADATLVEELRDAGAVVLAKTNLPDWATSWFGYSSVLGRTKNPYALDRDPGGSSSGTGAAVAANLATVGIGEDTGGSIRLPAAYNNLFGIRVTPGLLSRTGMSPLVVSQDTPGPMTRTVTDLATVLDVAVGYDPSDEYTAVTEFVEGVSYADALDPDALGGARIGVLRDAFGDPDDPDSGPVTRLVDEAIDTMAEAGAEIVDPVDIPSLDEHIERTSLYIAQSKRDLNDFFAAREDAPVDSVAELYDSGQYHEILDLLIGIAEDGPEDPEDEPDYWERVAAQMAFQRSILTVYADHDLDVLLCPDVQVVPPTAASIEAGELDTLTFPTNTVIASQSGCCAVSMPAGLTEEGLPVGVELIGKPYDEATLVGLAAAYERVVAPRRPPETAPALEN
ncbi:amidase [Halalkalicoccus jeotgali]|uniref:Amidase n=1 Tax=Halalkalicoccus jeotgali (strain DSM 18796 / CECT 7217 / JCM 14584 / KCTC 4019 / B3) TaxID=795797 RepID=D8J6F5_HALJB|nr:amidase [Halalkalicoccus jeotgali]ADJ13832.1 Amidase [Halalkalicoccus jeotgali B3]ELY34122.1 Amidase [Halalkalicoccus jeotgali B3]